MFTDIRQNPDGSFDRQNATRRNFPESRSSEIQKNNLPFDLCLLGILDLLLASLLLLQLSQMNHVLRVSRQFRSSLLDLLLVLTFVNADFLTTPKIFFVCRGRNESPAATSSTCKDLRQFCFTQIGKCLKVVTYPFSA